jgi:predicted RNA-binding Zn ribbon-like protein
MPGRLGASLPLLPQLDEVLRRHWRSTDPVNGTLALIAGEAIELMSSPARELIRECAAAPACSLLYLERSRGRPRRWSEMGSAAPRQDGGLPPPADRWQR